MSGETPAEETVEIVSPIPDVTPEAEPPGAEPGSVGEELTESIERVEDKVDRLLAHVAPVASEPVVAQEVTGEPETVAAEGVPGHGEIIPDSTPVREPWHRRKLFGRP